MNHKKRRDSQNAFQPLNTERLVKEYTLTYPNPLELCIQGLKIDISKRDMNIVSIINPYLLSLPSFVQVLKTETTSKNFEDIVTKISIVMSHRKVLKNRLIMRLGDKGNEFFIILNGKVGFMVVKTVKCYLNEEEFILFLLKLRKNNEFELLRLNILNNINCFDVKEDFDKWLRDIVYENKRNGNQHKRFSEELHDKMDKLQAHIEFFNNAYKSSPPQNHLTNLTVTPPIYIKLNNIDNANLDPKERKLACICVYQHMNSFTSGQNFGYIALESKNCKRTASVITLEDCDFGILTKEDYQKLIKEVNEKARKRLYNLVYSYPLFQSVAKGIFEYKYMHMFHYVKYKSGEQLMKEGEHVSTIMFIKNGEFELTIHKNIIEVNELIINLKQLKKQLQQQTYYCPNENDCQCSYEQKENEDFILNEQFKSIEFKELVNKKLPIKVSIVKDRDVLGLYDTVLEHSGTSLYNCTCLSTCGEGYQIETECLLNIAQKEERVLTEAKRFSIKKITCFIERLNKHKEAVFNKIKETENINKHLRSGEGNSHKSNSKNRFIDLERNSKYKHEQLLYNNKNRKTIIHNLSLEKHNVKTKRRCNLMLSPITDANMHKHKRKIKIAPLITHTEKHYEKEVHQKMRRLELLQEDLPHNRQLLHSTRTNVSPNNGSDANGFKWNHKLNHSLALMKQIQEVKTMCDSYSGILSTYVTTKKAFNNNTNREPRSRNKMHSYTNSELNSLQVNKTENRLLPTIYRSTMNANINNRANVNVIDCLILDKFNTLYKRGLIKK